MLKLLDRGIELSNLLKSNVFVYFIEFDSWPQTHSNTDKKIVPYNGSIFDIRDAYSKVFPELANEELNDKRKKTNQHNKLFKINYHLNLIPDMNINSDNPLI